MEDETNKEMGNRLTNRLPSWYAVYTMSRHEAKVEKVLQQKGMEVFLPRVITPRRWHNRKLSLTLPLFPGYLFVHSTLDTYDYLQILKAPGVVRILGNGRPTPVPEETVGSVRAIMESDQPFYPWRYLEKGKQVRVLDGPLAGTIGVIQGRKEKKRRLIVSVELFQRSVAVELDDDAVERWS
jgi:transcription antitermination factor NusG